MILKNKYRSLFILLVTTALTLLAFTALPQVRAAIGHYLGSYNGIHISFDQENNTLTTSGNTQAILHQDTNEVAIEGATEDTSDLVVIKKPPISPLSLADIQAQYPNFLIPSTLPDGYILTQYVLYEEVSISETPHGLLLSWQHPTGNTITFYQGQQPAAEATKYDIAPQSNRDSHITLTWSSPPHFYQITTTDDTLSEADLRRMIP